MAFAAEMSYNQFTNGETLRALRQQRRAPLVLTSHEKSTQRIFSEKCLPSRLSSSDRVIAGGRSVPFPKRLLNLLRREAIHNPHIVRWSKDGRAFYVDDEVSFVRHILPRHGFKASKMQSFQRNLNIYGFTRLSKGPYASGYVHAEFGRDISEERLEWIGRENGSNKVVKKTLSTRGDLLRTSEEPASIRSLNMKRKGGYSFDHEDQEVAEAQEAFAAGYGLEPPNKCRTPSYGQERPRRFSSSRGGATVSCRSASRSYDDSDSGGATLSGRSVGSSYRDSGGATVSCRSASRSYDDYFAMGSDDGLSNMKNNTSKLAQMAQKLIEHSAFEAEMPKPSSKLLKASSFWSFPHVSSAKVQTSSFQTTHDMNDCKLDRIYVKKCIYAE